MEGATLLLIFTFLGVVSSGSFYGDSITFLTPQKRRDGTFMVTFHHRQNGRRDCEVQSTFSCNSDVCTSFQQSDVVQTDQDDTGQDRWCQSEGLTQAVVSAAASSFSLSTSGCCWLENLNGQTNWTSMAELDLGTRSDTLNFNSCPVTATVSSIRIPQNCFTKLHLLAHDPDRDHLRCSFVSDTTPPSNVSLDQDLCTLTPTGTVDEGVHVLELLLEDFPSADITMTYSDGTTAFREASVALCKVKLQFSVEILPPIPRCTSAHVKPAFLSTTPSHGDVLYATVGEEFQLHARAQAHHSTIHDFQVSGPQNMSKVFTDERNGEASLTLSWTPQHRDLSRSVPLCFTAETMEAQSDMRCVVVMVTQSSVIQGKASVTCSANKMVVALEKASMPGIDMNFLSLRDQSCSLTSNDTHIIGIMSFTTCGTKLEDNGDFIVFKNEITSFELPTQIIVRRRSVKIDFSCQFPKMLSISSFYTLHNSEYIFTESDFGSFGYTFEIYRDSTFTVKVEASEYPVEVKLLDTFYMGIQAQSQLPNVKLFVESCRGTPDDNPDNSLSYDLISNGCVQDETLKVHPSDQTSYNFEVQAFKFTGSYDQVYITCSVILCDPDSPLSRCAQGCLSNPSRRRRRALDVETVSHDIIQGPLRFVSHQVPIADMTFDLGDMRMKLRETPVTELPPPPLSSSGKSGVAALGVKAMSVTLVFAGLFVVSLVSLLVVLLHFTRKTKAEDCKSLLVSD